MKVKGQKVSKLVKKGSVKVNGQRFGKLVKRGDVKVKGQKVSKQNEKERKEHRVLL